MKSEILKKVANVLRSQEQEKLALKDESEVLRKEADINRTVLNMIKEDILDSSDIDSKIAEFKSDPNFLKTTMDFFEKSSEIGEVSGEDLPEAGQAEQNFYSNLTSN